MTASIENQALGDVVSGHQPELVADTPAVRKQPNAVATDKAPLIRLGDRDRLFMLISGSVFFALMLFQYVRMLMDKPEPLPWERGEAFQAFRVEVNSATWVEWMQLPGIGQTMAFRIIADRDINGPFSGIDDVMRVDGIGPRTLDKMRPWLTIDGSTVPGDVDDTVNDTAE